MRVGKNMSDIDIIKVAGTSFEGLTISETVQSRTSPACLYSIAVTIKTFSVLVCRSIRWGGNFHWRMLIIV